MTAVLWLLLFTALVVTLLVGQWWVGSALDGRRSRRILEQGEVVLLKAEAMAQRVPQTLSLPSVWRLMPLGGSLHLTSRRLLWRRHLGSAHSRHSRRRSCNLHWLRRRREDHRRRSGHPVLLVYQGEKGRRCFVHDLDQAFRLVSRRLGPILGQIFG